MRCAALLGLFVLSLAHAGCSAPSSAPPIAPPIGPGLHVDGDVAARTLSLEALQSLGPVDVPWTHKDQTRTFAAVPLEAVLRSVGVDAGEMGPDVAPSAKRAGWKYAVIATASDGFQATFSAAEVFHGMGRTDAYVAIGENGLPIDAATGPLRLIVTTDGEGSRSVRNLERLTVVDLRRLVPER